MKLKLKSSRKKRWKSCSILNMKREEMISGLFLIHIPVRKMITKPVT